MRQREFESIMNSIANACNRTWGPRGWEKQFKRGDRVEVDVHYEGTGKGVFSGTVIRRHRVGWLIRSGAENVYAPAFTVRPAKH